MSAHTSFAPRDRWRLRQNKWWILVALLGIATVHSFIPIVHDQAQRHVAANMVRKATAERIAAFGSDRALALGLETFAPVSGPNAGGHDGPREMVAALVRYQATAAQCKCRDTLPVGEFFRFDLKTGGLEFAMMPASGMRALSPTTLAELARRDAARKAARPMIHFTSGRTLGDAGALTYVQFDSTSSPRAVFGLVAPVRSIAASLFSKADPSTAVIDRGARMVTLDSVSLLVADADSTELFGALTRVGRYSAAYYPAGPLEGLSVEVALTGSQIHPPLLMIIPMQQLWHNGLLILATTLVTIFAIGSSRRETLLARARSDFVAGVSHDLRMPLAQILLAGETLVTHPDTSERERLGLSKAILRETRRLVGLVENLLLFSRTGRVELKPRLGPVCVDDVFAGVVEAVELAAADVRQPVEAIAAPAVGVLGDASLLRQAIVNLVDNALKYGKPGQSIHLSATRSATTVRIHVDDEGPGIPAAERARVFQPYERLGRDQTSERTGTGLGLAVVRQIVQSCRGKVWLEESARGGTRAVIELQAAEIPAPADRTAELV